MKNEISELVDSISEQLRIIDNSVETIERHIRIVHSSFMQIDTARYKLAWLPKKEEKDLIYYMKGKYCPIGDAEDKNNGQKRGETN